MSTVQSAISWECVTSTTTVRQFRRAIGLALAVVAFGACIYAVETLWLRSDNRLVENPGDLMTRAFGLTHFVIGWLFLFTSPRLRNGPSLLRLVLFTSIGLGLCWVFGSVGGRKNLFALMAFYSFFLLHEVRDEAHIYQSYGDAPPSDRRCLHLFVWAVCLGFASLMSIAFLVKATLTQKRILAEESPLVVNMTIGALFVATVIATFLAVRSARRSYGSLSAALSAHRPLTAVYGGIFLILLIGSFFGTAGLNLIILIHASTWLVFVRHQLKQRRMPQAHSVWSWIRSTPGGIVTLHVVVIAVVLLLLTLRVYVWHKSGPISLALAGSSYPYWGILHIAMAFWRR